jgi:hypothetical protein
LLHKPDPISVDGENNGRVVLFYDPVNPLLAVRAEDLVLAEAHPVVAIYLAAGKCGDGLDRAALDGVHHVSLVVTGFIEKAPLLWNGMAAFTVSSMIVGGENG